MRKIKILMVPLCILLMQVDAVADEACDITFEFTNRERRVPGPVNVECSGIHDDDGWGNWGVLSNMGRIRNGDQFAGWYRKHGHRMWQSCTRENPPPSCKHYNVNCRTQAADPYNPREYAGASVRHWHETCREQFSGGVFIVRRAYMSVHELDWPDEDDHITTIRYGDVRVPIECSGAWRCRGQSSWYSPRSGNSAVTANISVKIRTRRHSR